VALCRFAVGWLPSCACVHPHVCVLPAGCRNVCDLATKQAAIRDPNPVVVLENEIMYGVAQTISAECMDPEWVPEIGKVRMHTCRSRWFWCAFGFVCV